MHTKSFASALKGALREDPDIILVGEMRDLETIELAITAVALRDLLVRQFTVEFIKGLHDAKTR